MLWLKVWSRKKRVVKDVLNVKSQNDIPELNVYQCGTYKMHSLKDAQEIAKTVLRRDIDIMDNEALTLDLSKVD